MSCSSSVTDPHCHSGEPLREQQGLHCRRGTPHTITPQEGAAPAPFSHTLHSLWEAPRQTVENMEKCLKSYFCLYTYQSDGVHMNLRLSAQTCTPSSSSLLPTNYRPYGRETLACTVMWGIISPEKQQAGFFLHSAKPISAGGSSTVHSHSCPYYWDGVRCLLIFFPVLVLEGTEHQMKEGTWVKPHLAGIINT